MTLNWFTNHISINRTSFNSSKVMFYFVLHCKRLRCVEMHKLNKYKTR